MSTQLVTLPIVDGGLGAGVDVTSLGSRKTMIVTGIGGKINLEISNDGGVTWCQISKSFKVNKNDQVDEFVAGLMRVNATSGSATEVQVVAERSIARVSAIPSAPSSGPGASLDVTSFGCETTVVVQGFSGNGSINIEISGDDAEWSTAYSFNKDGCETKNINAKFIRVNGNGATASVSLGSTDTAAIAGEPTITYVFRPGATGSDAEGSNVYTDEDAIIDALTDTANDGHRTVEFDSRFSPDVNVSLGNRQVCLITKAWPMENVKASCWHGLGGQTPPFVLFGLSLTVVEFKNGGSFQELTLIEGEELAFVNSNLAAGSGVIPILLPINGIVGAFAPTAGAHLVVRGTAIQFAITDALATPMFEVQDAPGAVGPPYSAIHLTGAINTGFGSNLLGVPVARPLVNVPAGRRFNLLMGGGELADDAIEGAGGVSLVPYGANALQGNFTSSAQPLLTGGLDLFSNFRSNVIAMLNPTTNDGVVSNDGGYSTFVPIDMVNAATPQTVNIFVPAGPKEGELLIVKDTSVAGVGAGAGVGNEINVFPKAGDTIDGLPGPYVINTPNGSVTLRCDGATNWVVIDSHSAVVLNNFTSAVAPVVGDDSTLGYAAGSQWIDTVGVTSWICIDASVGAAVWNQTS